MRVLILVVVMVLSSLGAAAAGEGVRVVTVESGSFFYKPERITLKVGVPVEFAVSKGGGIIPHNFVIDAPEAGMDIVVGLSKRPKTVRFTPTQTGTYPFYCDKSFLFFKSHRARGMEGEINVVE